VFVIVWAESFVEFYRWDGEALLLSSGFVALGTLFLAFAMTTGPGWLFAMVVLMYGLTMINQMYTPHIMRVGWQRQRRGLDTELADKLPYTTDLGAMRDRFRLGLKEHAGR